MAERFRLPAKRKRGRPPGAINRRSALDIQQALLGGQLPHMSLLEWAQTGMMEQVVTELFWYKCKRKEGNKLVETWRYRKRAMRDKDGNVVKEMVPLDVDQRIAAADKGSKFFASAVTDEKVGRSEAELKVIYQRKGIETIELINTPLALPAPVE